MLKIDRKRGKNIAGLLYQCFSSEEILGNTETPEDILPKGMKRGSLDYLLFITLTVAIDYSEIAILYTIKNSNQTFEASLPSMIEKVLQTKGIPCSWTAENVSAKKHYDITTNSVSICTIHSAKGFDYTCVFLIGLDLLESGSSWTQSQIDNLTYVAITRARYRLFTPFVNKTQVLKKLMSSL